MLNFKIIALSSQSIFEKKEYSLVETYIIRWKRVVHQIEKHNADKQPQQRR